MRMFHVSVCCGFTYNHKDYNHNINAFTNTVMHFITMIRNKFLYL